MYIHLNAYVDVQFRDSYRLFFIRNQYAKHSFTLLYPIIYCIDPITTPVCIHIWIGNHIHVDETMLYSLMSLTAILLFILNWLVAIANVVLLVINRSYMH